MIFLCLVLLIEVPEDEERGKVCLTEVLKPSLINRSLWGVHVDNREPTVGHLNFDSEELDPL